MNFIKKGLRVLTAGVCAVSVMAGSFSYVNFNTATTTAYAATETDAVIDFDYYTNADYALVDTENLNDDWAENYGLYRNSSKVDNGNKITLNRIESRHDPKRTTGSVVIEKTNTKDAYYFWDKLQSHDMGTFPYFYYEGRVRVTTFGQKVSLAFFRDSVTKSTNIDIEPFYIDKSGNVITSTGKTVKTLGLKKWLNFKFVFDVNNNKGRLYVDNALVDDGISLNGLKKVCMLKIAVNTDSTTTACSAEFDKLKLLGMRHDYDPLNPDFHPSFFSDDTGIISWLADGDKTAFYGYSQNVFGKGQKHIRVDKPLYGGEYGNTLYVSAKALNVGYGFSLNVNSESKVASDSNVTLSAGSKSVTYKGAAYTLDTECLWYNGTVYVPVVSFAKNALKHHVKADANGLVITSATSFNLITQEATADYLIQVATRSGYKGKVTPIKALNWFMSFERPDADTIENDFWNTTSDGSEGHPRVIGTKADFDRIRANWQSDADLNKMVTDILKKADATLNVTYPEYALPDKQRILGQARSCLEYFRNLGFAYQVTGHDKYAEKAWEIMQGLLSYPDWNPSHMIDTAELVGGCAVAFDWCYDYFTDEQRQYIYDKIKKLGIKPIHDAAHDITTTRYEWAGANDYIASKSNFNTVINGSQLMGLCAFAEFEPEFTYDAMMDAIRSIEYTMLVYRPDGIWMESPAYWDYSAGYLARGIGSVINTTGNHYGIMDAQGVERTGRWILSQNSYCGINNFHDASAGKFNSSFVGWFGRVYDDKVLSAVARDYALYSRNALVEDAIWYVADNTASIDELPLDMHFDGFDTVSSRSSYSDSNAFFYATHGGQVTCYHSQYDVCSFVMDLNGIRWAYDLGKDDYNVRRDQNGFNKMYRDIAESHNVMLFNQSVPGQVTTGCATMTKWEYNDYGSIAIYDVSSVYSDNTNYSHRGFKVGDDRQSLTIRDEFSAKSDMPAHWFMCTPADVEIIDNNNAILTEAGKRLKMEVVTNVPGYKLTVGAAEPLPTSPKIEGQDANEGYSRIAVELPLKANTDYYVMVKLSDYDTITTDIGTDNAYLSEWRLPQPETQPLSRKVLDFESFESNTDYTDDNFEVQLRMDETLYSDFTYNKYSEYNGNDMLEMTLIPGKTHGDTRETALQAMVMENEVTTPSNGEYYELSFDYKWDGTPVQKDVRVVNNGWSGQPAYLYQINKNGWLSSPYLGTGGICTLNKGVNYNIKLVVKANNTGENTVTKSSDTALTTTNAHQYWLYINGALLKQGSFRNSSRNNGTVFNCNHFEGFEKVLFLLFSDGAQNAEYTNTNPPKWYIDNVIVSKYEKQPLNIVEFSHSYNFDNLTADNTEDFLSQAKADAHGWQGQVNGASYYDMKAQKGALGRWDDDASFVSTVSEDIVDYNRLELVEPGYSITAKSEQEITAPMMNTGEYYDMEIYMAYSGTGTSVGVQGFYTNSAATDGKQYGYIVAIDGNKGGIVTAFNKDFPELKLEPNRWYKFNVVVFSGNDNSVSDSYKNWYKIYIDDELKVGRTVFDMASQRSGTENYTRFLGFQKYWIGTVNYGAFNSTDFDTGYFDDFKVTYCGLKEPIHSRPVIAADGNSSPLDLYLGNSLTANIDSRCIDFEKYSVKNDDHARFEYQTPVAKEGENKLRLTTGDGTRYYYTLNYGTQDVRHIPFGDSYGKELAVGEKDFTKASYVPGLYGKAVDDYALKMTTTGIWNNYYVDGTDGTNPDNWVDKGTAGTLKTRDSMNPFLNFATEGTGSNIKINNKGDYSISLSVIADGECESTNVQFIPASDKRRENVIRLFPDGRIMIRECNVDGKLTSKINHVEAGTFNPNEWLRLTFNVYSNTNMIEIIVDGKLIATQQLFTDEDMATGNARLARFKVEQNYDQATTKANPKNGYFAIDDVVATNGSAPEFKTFDWSKTTGFITGIFDDTLVLNKTLAVSQLSDAAKDFGEGASLVAFEGPDLAVHKTDADDTVTTGNCLVANNNYIYKYYYSVVNPTDPGTMGTITKVSADKSWSYGTNKVDVTVNYASDVVLAVACYTSSGELKSVTYGKCDDGYEQTTAGIIQRAQLDVNVAADVTKITVFAYSSANVMRPVAKPYIVK